MRPPGKPRLLFVVTEDWFFCSHFLPMAEAATAVGYDVAVACRVRAHGDEITKRGYRLVPFESERKSLNPFAVLRSVLRMRQLMKTYQPDVVHLIALRSVIIGGVAARLAGIQRRIMALTGLGLIGASQGQKTKVSGLAVRLFVRHAVDGPEAHYIFENRSDPVRLGLAAQDEKRLTVLGGAGVDPAQFLPCPLPASPPLRVAFVGRMVWSKGVDMAVEAVRLARARGHAVELSLFGAPDPDNPRSIAVETLQTWGSEAGIHWHGPIDQTDVSAVWASHHCAVLASRGGEGLPRALLEAASCGRAIVTTDVPGCRDLVRDGVEGFLVPVDDARALAAVMEKLCLNPDILQAMGSAARKRVLEGFTTEHLKESMKAIYVSMLPGT